MKTKTLHFINHIAFVALFVLGLILLPNVSRALAQTGTADEVEYVTTEFAPLKICNVAGPGVAVGTPFSFTITTAEAGSSGLQEPYTTKLIVLAGPAAAPGTTQQNGFCDFAAGPFTDSNGVAGGALINGVGSFSVGSTVFITELQNSPGLFVSAILSTNTSVVADLVTRTATITSIINGINEVQFVNKAATGCELLSPNSSYQPDCTRRPIKRKRVGIF